MMKRLILVSLVLLTADNIFAESLADTPENRRQQAERYLQAVPPKKLVDDIAKKIAGSEARHDSAVQSLISQLDFDALKRAVTNLVVKHFTAEEIRALADFYGSPEGKSVMSKYPDYMAEMMPVVHAEIAKAHARAAQSKPTP
jgi:hypothetical protein